MRRADISERMADLRQVASVRRIVLDEGVEQGVCALAFSTGGGLDFWVLVDRSLDIGPLWWRGLPVAPQGPAGFRHPRWHRRDAEGTSGFKASFAGFLVTCGLEHIRQPADGHPMHGRLPFTPAALGGYGADWQRDVPILYCEGDVVQRHPGGEHFRLRRRIEAEIGGTRLSIRDTVENLAATPQRQASLYHFNIGHPALDDGTMVEHAGRRRLGPLRLPDDGASREAFSMAVPPEERATCIVTCPKTTFEFGWATATLPHLQLWHDLGPGACVLSIEPCTSARLQGGASGEEALLAPGALRRYALDVSITEASQDNPRT
jgi:hypothetical protein